MLPDLLHDGSVMYEVDANLITLSSSQQSVIVETPVPESHDSSQQNNLRQATLLYQLNNTNASIVQNETLYLAQNDVCFDGFNAVQAVLSTFDVDEILRVEENCNSTIDELVNVNQEINEPNSTIPVVVCVEESKGKVVHQKVQGASKRKF